MLHDVIDRRMYVSNCCIKQIDDVRRNSTRDCMRVSSLCKLRQHIAQQHKISGLLHRLGTGVSTLVRTHGVAVVAVNHFHCCPRTAWRVSAQCHCKQGARAITARRRQRAQTLPMHDGAVASIDGSIAQWLTVGVAICNFGVLVHLNLDSVCGIVLVFIGLALLAAAGVNTFVPLRHEAREIVALVRIALVVGVIGVGIWAGVDMIVLSRQTHIN